MREDKLDIFILCVKKNTFKVNRKALMEIKQINKVFLKLFPVKLDLKNHKIYVKLINDMKNNNKMHL